MRTVDMPTEKRHGNKMQDLQKRKEQIGLVFLLPIRESSVAIGRQDQTTLLFPFFHLLSSGDDDNNNAKKKDQLVFSSFSSSSSAILSNPILETQSPAKHRQSFARLHSPRVNRRNLSCNAMSTDSIEDTRDLLSLNERRGLK